MIPSRGLHFSKGAIGTGRRCLEEITHRSFSTSTAYHASQIARSALARSAARPSMKIISQLPSRRFNSTAPVTSASPAAAAAAAPPAPAAIEPAAAGAMSTPTTAPVEGVDSIDLLGNIYDIPETIGYLKSLGLDFGWGPTACVEWTLEHIHILAQTPWWASIGLTAIAFRILLLKPYMGAADNAAKIAAVAPITKPLQAKMTELSRTKDTAAMMAVRRDIQLIHQRAGIKMWKSFTPMIQMFIGYGTFVLLRAMAKLPVPGLETGGILWFQNLALPDPYLILPIAAAGILHLVLRRGGETGVSTMSTTTMKLFAIGMPLMSLVFTYWLPAGLQLSFLISGVLSAGQATLFRNDTFRSTFGMSPMPSPVDPFAKPDVVSRFREDILTAEHMKEKYEAPNAQGVLGGLKERYADIKQSANKSVSEMKEYTGQQRKDGKRTKQEIKAAEEYEVKRAKEERQRLTRMEREKRAARNARKAAKGQ